MAVLFALLFTLVTLWFDDELLAVLVLWLLELFEADALFHALLRLEELASCAAFAEVEFVDAFFVFAAVEAELTFDAELLVDAELLALLAAFVAVLDALPVALLADAPLDALRLSAAVPDVVDVLPPLEDGLLKDELPTDVEDPFVPADAVFEVLFALAVLLLLLALFATALSVDDADFTLLAFCVLLAVEALVVALDLFALLEAEDISVVALLLLALAFWAALSVEVEL